MRLWGSGSFIFASLGCGLVIGGFGAAAVLPLLVAAGALMVLGVHLLPREMAGRNIAATPARPRIRLADAVELARSPRFLLFLLAASTIQASHALYYTFGTLHWREQGFHDGTIGALWALGVVAGDRPVRGLGAHPCHFGRLQIAAGRGRCRGRPLGADGWRSLTLCHGGAAMPARF